MPSVAVQELPVRPFRRRKKLDKKQMGKTLAVLDANDGNLSETGRQLNVPVATVYNWRENWANDPLVERYKKLATQDLAEKCQVIAASALERLQAEIDDVDVDKLHLVADKMLDKRQLLSGQPTVITTNVSDTAQAHLERLRQEFAAQLESRTISDDHLIELTVQDTGVSREELK